ncbi:MAG: gephyrin-like molybdotransferase Glp [Planctomycetota bacterium]
MRGFRDRAPVDAFQAWVDALPAPHATETVPLDGALGRVLVEDLVSDVDVPAFERAAMDGWAVRGEDTFGAAATDPVALRVVGRALPGHRAPCAVGPGEACRIMTGAPLPEGADAVLRAEDGAEDEGRLAARAPVAPGRHVGRVGEDVRSGDRLLEAGRRLRPQDVALASSVGRPTLLVCSRPTVDLLLTGDELLPAGSRPHDASIPDANGPLLSALVRRDGGRLGTTRLLPDRREAIEEALREATADLVLVVGGSSVGEEDDAPRVGAGLGDLVFHGIATRPAAPAGGGRLKGRPVFLIPGNPVSCLAAYDLFAGRALRRFAGRPPAMPYARRRLPLARKVSSALGRLDYVRVRVTAAETIDPVMSRGASILSSTTRADGFLLVPASSEGWPPGTTVEVHLYGA